MAPSTEAQDGLLSHLAMALDLRYDRPPDNVSALLGEVETSSPRGHDELLAWFAAWEQGTLRPSLYEPAVRRVRTLADDRTPLTWAIVQDVQGTLLDLPGPAPFRRGPAYARGGLRRYGWFPAAESMLARKLEADACDGLHPVLQAARAYLDLIHFHPFEDGNTRAASLWLEYFLRRARIQLPPLRPLLALRQHPGDPARAWTFVLLLCKLCLRRGSAHAEPQ